MCDFKFKDFEQGAIIKSPFAQWMPPAQEVPRKPPATILKKVGQVKKKAVVREAKRPSWVKPVESGEFDNFYHGYYQCSDGTLTYRHQDGRVFRNCTGCDCFD